MTSNLKNELRDQIDGQSNEYKEVIIQNETQKFIEIFDKVFSESENEKTIEDIDNIDGIVEDIFNTIVNRIKAMLKQKFIKDLLEKEEEEEEENGEDEISAKTET